MKTLSLGLLSYALLLSAQPTMAQDAIPPETIAQLKRLEPLNETLIRAFVEAKRLTSAQGDFILKNLAANGALNLPEGVAIPTTGSTATPTSVSSGSPSSTITHTSPQTITIPTFSDGTLDVLSWIRQDDQRQPIASAAETNRIRGMVRAYRFAGTNERQNIRRELGNIGAIANPIVAEFYTDPIDLNLKKKIWRGMSRRENPLLAGYIAATHQALMREANPVLIPHAKDVGGLLFRRRSGNEEPRELYFTSRELREAIIELEESISHAPGIRAVTYLTDVYVARYESSEAPMRDGSRDRKNIIRACGGDADKFDQDKPETWSCSLPSIERVMIAERLAPHLRSKEGEIRRMAVNGMQVVLDKEDRKLKDRLRDAEKKWNEFESWWRPLRSEMLRKQ